MLVDIDETKDIWGASGGDDGEFMDLLFGEGDNPLPFAQYHVQTGVYTAGPNLGNLLKEEVVKDEFPDLYHKDQKKYGLTDEELNKRIAQFHEDYANGRNLNSYGVADTIEQMLDIYKDVLADPDRKYVVSFMHVVKEHEPEQQGWRWRKWGPYIGTKQPQHEYIKDEDDWIQDVWVFNIIELN